MPSDVDRIQRQIRARHEQVPDRERQDEAPDLVALEAGQDISPDLARRLQPQMGNQAIADLIARQAGASLGEASEGQEEEVEEVQEEAQEEVREEDHGRSSDAQEGAAVAHGAGKGLPLGPGAAAAQDLQFGGDDDDDVPSEPTDRGTPLHFLRAGRGNLARLEALRGMGRIPTPAMEEATAIVESLPGVPRRPDASRDEAFQTPLEACRDLQLIAGRSLTPEDLADLPGSLDPIGRPVEVGRYIARHGQSPLARSLGRLLGALPGSLLPEVMGGSAAVARLSTLATLAQAADGWEDASVRDRAIRTALDVDALERVLDVAGDISETVPPGPTLFSRLHGRQPVVEVPAVAPSPLAVRWWIPALERVGQYADPPVPGGFHPPPRPPDDDPDDPVLAVDALLYRLTAPPDSDPTAWCVTEESLAGLHAGLQEILATGGRMQVELAAAAEAITRPEVEPEIHAILTRAYRACREVARTVVPCQAVLDPLIGAPVPEALADLEVVEARLAPAPTRLVEIRTEATCALAAVAARPQPDDARHEPTLPSPHQPPSPTLSEALHLADALETAGDSLRARSTLEVAIDLSRSGPDTCWHGQANLLLGALLLRMGMPRDAAPHLEVAAHHGQVSGDSLTGVAACTLSAALQVADGTWADALQTASMEARLARVRRNPTAILDAACTQATAFLASHRPDATLDALLAAGEELGARAATLQLTILAARLAEAREQIGEAAFAAHLRSRGIHAGG